MSQLRATSHIRVRARDHCTSSTLVGGKSGAGRSCFTLHLRVQRSMWMQDECKVYMDSYMASNGSCFMFTWTLFKNHLLKVGLTQKQETLALRNLTTVDLLYFIMCEDHAWIEIHWTSIWLRARSHMTSHYTWGLVTTLHNFGSVLKWPLDTSFWALIISWLRLLARVWSGPGDPRIWELGIW